MVRLRAPLLTWRAHSGVLGRRSYCQQSRLVRGQHAPVAAAASAATSTRRAARAAPAQSTTIRRRPKADGGDSAEEAELIDEEAGKGNGDGHAAAASLHASQQRGAAAAQPSGEAGPSAEAKKPWLDGQWLKSLYAQQAELDRLQAATKLGTVAEDVRTCWAVIVVIYTGQEQCFCGWASGRARCRGVGLQPCVPAYKRERGSRSAPVVSSFC